MTSTLYNLDRLRPEFRPALRAGTGHPPVILVVENDASTRRFIRAALTWGTSAVVKVAADPEAALSMLEAAELPVDLLISDIDLGAAKTGIDLAREALAFRPTTKVLLISGTDCPGRRIPSGCRFLAKPFPIPTFLEFVEKLCNTGG